MKKPIKYLFCINTGRSGSHYLSSIFNHLDNTSSQHEMKPIGHSHEMRQFFLGNEEPMKSLSENKLKLISEQLKTVETFIETSHLFIKGFGWFFAKVIPNEEIGVIILDRDKEKIVSSLERINCVALSNRGQNWVLTPNIKNPIVPPPSILGFHRFYFHVMRLFLKVMSPTTYKNKINDKKAPEYGAFVKKYNRQSLEWYYDETTALAKKFQHQFPKIRYFNANIDDLNDKDKFNELLEFYELKLKPNIDINKLIGKPTNLKKRS